MHDQTPTPPRLFRVSFDLLVGHGVTATTPQVTPIDADFPAEGTHAITSGFARIACHALAGGGYDDLDDDARSWHTTLAVYEVARSLLDAMGTDGTDVDMP